MRGRARPSDKRGAIRKGFQSVAKSSALDGLDLLDIFMANVCGTKEEHFETHDREQGWRRSPWTVAGIRAVLDAFLANVPDAELDEMVDRALDMVWTAEFMEAEIAYEDTTGNRWPVDFEQWCVITGRKAARLADDLGGGDAAEVH